MSICKTSVFSRKRSAVAFLGLMSLINFLCAVYVYRNCSMNFVCSKPRINTCFTKKPNKCICKYKRCLLTRPTCFGHLLRISPRSEFINCYKFYRWEAELGLQFSLSTVNIPNQ